MSEAVETTDHKTIQRWIEVRGGHPSRISGAKEGGILRVDFGKPEDSLEGIEWEDFFSIFDENNLSFLYEDKTKDGKTSRFSKFVAKH